MGKKGIKVGSVTYAVKGRELLQKNGYRAYMSRNLHPGAGEGCGYIIYVSNFDKRCFQILKNGGVKIYGTIDTEDSL